MKCRLRTYDTTPTGGYIYAQTQGIKRSFAAQPLIEALAQEVSAFRRGNSLPRANIRQCVEDIDHYTAARLGCNRQWTVPIDSPAEAKTIALSQSHPLISHASGAPCRGCGAQVFSVPQ